MQGAVGIGIQMIEVSLPYKQKHSSGTGSNYEGSGTVREIGDISLFVHEDR